MLMATQLIGFSARSIQCSAPTTIFSDTLTADSDGWAGYSIRQVATLTGGGNQVRVTISASSAQAITLDNVGIGIRDTLGNTVSTPIEVLFSGGSGVAISAGGTAVSDWVELSVSAADELIVIMDVNGSSSVDAFRRLIPNGGEENYQKTATDSYNQAAPAGFTESTNNTIGLTQIEARTCA